MANFGNTHNRFRGLLINPEYSHADFGQAQKVVKKSEGGYQASTADSGNYVDGKLIGTNWGISAPVLKTYLGRTPSVADMKNLSYETALKIYKSNYWNPIGGDQIKNDSIALLLYDGAVNMGVNGIKKIVNDSLNTGTYNVNSINSANQKKLFDDIKKRREVFYRAKGGSFLTSWLTRLNAVTYSTVQSVKRHPIATVLVTATILFSAYFLIFGKTPK